MIFNRKNNNLDKKLEEEFGELSGKLRDYYSARKIQNAELTELDSKLEERKLQKLVNFFEKIMLGIQANRKILAYSTVSTLAVLVLTFAAYQYFGQKKAPVTELPNIQTVPQIQLLKSAESFEGVDVGSSFTIISEKILDQQSTEANLKISPEIEYSINWKSEKEFEIKPAQTLSKETIYTVTLEKGTVLGEREELETTLDWKFATTPVFSIVGITPKSGSRGAPADTAIEVEFNYRDIDMESFNANFSIEPAVAGRTELIDNKVVFLPDSPLNNNVSYVVNVGNGVKTTTGEIIESGAVSYFQVSSVTSEGKSISSPYFQITPSARIVVTSSVPDVKLELENLSAGVKAKVYSINKAGLLAALSLPENSIDALVRPEDSLLNLVSEHEIMGDQTVQFSNLTEGMYFVEYISSDLNESKYQIFNYSKYGLYFIDGVNYDNIWGFNLENNSILTGANLELYKLDPIPELVSTTTLAEDGNLEEESSYHLIVGEYDGRTFVLDKASESYWQNPDFLGSGWMNDMEGYRAYIYTDRPVYKPGEVVKFKGIVRRENDFNYSVEKGLNVTVAVPKSYFGYGERDYYYKKDFTVENEYGTISGEFTLPGDVFESYIYVNLEINNKSVASASPIFVSPYTKPQFNIDIEFDKKEYFSGENALVKVTASRYSGEPARDKEIELEICTSHIYQPLWPDETYLENEKKSFTYYGCSNTLQELNTKLDANGQLTHQLQANFSSTDSNVGAITARVVIKGESNTDSVGRTAAIIYEGKTDIFVKSASQTYNKGEEVELNIGTFASGTNTPTGGQNYTFEVYRYWTEEYQSGTKYDERQKKVIPIYSYRGHADLVADFSGTTDDSGMDTVKYTPQEDGSYYINSSINGNIKKKYTFYVVDTLGAYVQTKGIEIKPEKEKINAGESIELEITSNLDSEIPVVLTVQRADVYEKRIVNVPTDGTTVSLPSKSSYSPSVTISGAYSVEGRSYGERMEKVIIVDQSLVEVIGVSHKINIEVSTDKSIYGPGDEVQVDIKTTDSNNNPVASELSISAVDKALLTAEYRYNPDGMDDTFYKSIKQFSNSYTTHKSIIEGGYGGGGADRDNFKDGAYWDAHVRTDSQGKASVKFKLPDNLTIWTLDIRGVTVDTEVGQTTYDIQVSKDIYVSFLLPQFIRNQDKLAIPAQLMNNTDSVTSGQMKISVEGGSIEGPDSYDVSLGARGNTSQTFTVLPQTQDAETLKIRIAYESGGQLTDAVTLSTPILPMGIYENNTQGAVITKENNTLLYNVDNAVNLAQSKYKLSISPSIVGQRIFVNDFYYTDSSIELANLILRNLAIIENYDAIQPNQPREIMVNQIQSALENLMAIQNANGGFGYFSYDTPNPETTAFVFEAVASAMNADYEVMQILDQGAVYLKNQLRSDKTSLQTKSYILYALSITGDEEILSIANYMLSIRSQFQDSPVTFSYLTLALVNLGNNADGLILISEIERLANQTERWAWWEEPNVEYNLIQSKDISSTAAYDALESYNSTLSEKALTFLLENRYCLSCQTTESTKLLVTVLKHHADEISSADVSFSMTVNDNEQTINSEIKNGRQIEVEIPSGLMKNGENKIQISSDLDGKLYTKLYTEEFTPAEAQEAVSNRLQITTRYYNLLTGVEGTEFDAGTPVVMEMTVTPEIDGRMIDVTGFVPAGTEILSTYLRNQVSDEILRKFYREVSSTRAYSWGVRELDRKKFNLYSANAGESYKFSIPLIVTHRGSFQIPGARAFFKNSPDVEGVSGGVVFTGR